MKGAAHEQFNLSLQFLSALCNNLELLFVLVVLVLPTTLLFCFRKYLCETEPELKKSEYYT